MIELAGMESWDVSYLARTWGEAVAERDSLAKMKQSANCAYDESERAVQALLTEVIRRANVDAGKTSS